MHNPLLTVLVIVSLLFLVLVRTSLAAWPNQPSVNLPLCSAANDQVAPKIIADGAGGVIVTWEDYRSGTSFDIYAQHVLGSGAVDPAWPGDGRGLCTATNDQRSPTIVSDGAGGAIVTWYDFRSGTNYDIYVQHVLASGAVDPAWPADGRGLCTFANNQAVPTIVSDGAGGAIVTWTDARNGGIADIYAQHVLASGAADPAWPADGRGLCNATNQQVSPTIVSDGMGGAVVTWEDSRNGGVADIYGQHVLASGTVDPVWPTDGRALCTATNQQVSPRIASDGAGGAIVTWADYRSGTNYDIYAQHVTESGWVAWAPGNGSVLCTALNPQFNPTIASDGAGGAIVTWEDYRNGGIADIYAQHIPASGVADPTWPANGRALCTALNVQLLPTIVSDGAGGAIVTWYDNRSATTNYDIYAHHVLASGVVDPIWPTEGLALSTATSAQYYPTIVSDGAGGAIVTWADLRSDNFDIYAQRVARFAYLGTPEAEIVSVRDVPNDQGGKVELSWNASYLDIASDPNLSAYDVLRSVPPNLAAKRLRLGACATSVLDPAMRTGADRLLVTITNAQTYYWEYLTSVGALHVSGYSYLALTAEDSTAAGAPKTAFMVAARNSGGSMFWPSRPDSGYSVDNSPPATPSPFTGAYTSGATHLHWGANSEPDLASYRLYRGNTVGFVPGPSNQIADLADTGYDDQGAAGSYYKLSAVDVHGNQSGYAVLSPSQITAVGGEALPATLAFLEPQPNPATRAASLRFALPRSARVALVIYDTSGRRVRMLVSETLPAGNHAIVWDLRDELGREVVAGLYFARLEVEGESFTQRIAALR